MPRRALDRPNFRLVARAGRRCWYVAWTEAGRTKTESTGVVRTGGQPCALANAALADAINHRHRAPDPTVAQIIAGYLEASRHRLTYQRIADACKPLAAALGDLRPDEVRGYVRAVAPSTLATEIRKYRAAMNWAVRSGWIHGFNDLAMPDGAKVPRDLYASRDQANRFLAECRALHLRTFATIGLISGARKAAILELTWDRVALDRGRVDFNVPGRTITNKRRGIVPISPPVRAFLEGVRRVAETNYVVEFDGHAPVSDIKRAWNAAAARAGLRWFTPHVMKHSVISWLAEDGFQVDQIADLTQTNPDTVRRIYRKFNPDYLAPMADALAGGVFDTTGLINAATKAVSK